MGSSSRLLLLSLWLCTTTYSSIAFGIDAPPKALIGGTALEYPRGRFQENFPPRFFKWYHLKPAHSTTVKIFRVRGNGQYDPVVDLLGRYDFTDNTRSLSWPQEFSRGNYVWIVEIYDSVSPHPIYVDTAHFQIEELKELDLRTRRVGGVVGFSRGQYVSNDSTYNIQYDTTPTTYGLIYANGNEEKLWNVSTVISDFVLRGEVQKTYSVEGNYQKSLRKGAAYQMEYFFGPTVRLFNFPRVRSSNGTTIATEEVTTLHLGGTLTAQRRHDLHFTLFTHLTVDYAVAGSVDVDTSLSNINYRARAGLLCSLFWPIGFSGEIQYNQNHTVTKDSGVDVDMNSSEWAVATQLLYSF